MELNNTTEVMEATETRKPSAFQSFFAIGAIVILIIVAVLFYLYFLGDASHFEDPEKHKPKDYFGTVFLGGPVVPILISFFLMVITFGIERFATIALATGRGSISAFVARVKELLATNQIDEAIEECDRQKGSVGNVIKSTLIKYKEMLMDISKDKEQKIAAIQKEQEEAVSLELPMLEKNLSIIATLASICTLVGLLGTVIGMIKAFSALAKDGAPDQVALATGISEALINTALGIGGSAFAIVFYNYFTTRIDTLSYNIDEAGYSILQNFNAQVK